MGDHLSINCSIPSNSNWDGENVSPHYFHRPRNSSETAATTEMEVESVAYYYEPIQSELEQNSSECSDFIRSHVNGTSPASQNENTFMFAPTPSPSANRHYQEDLSLQVYCGTHPTCLADRASLEAGIQQLTSNYQILLATHKITRESLIEQEVALGLVQDTSKRLEADYRDEVSDLKSKIWKLESDWISLKTGNNAYKVMLTKTHVDLLNIQKKVNKLCHNSRQCSDMGTWDSSLNDPTDGSSHNIIAQINCTLDQALNHNVAFFPPKPFLAEEASTLSLTSEQYSAVGTSFMPETALNHEIVAEMQVANEEVVETHYYENAGEHGAMSINGQPAMLPLPERQPESNCDDDVILLAEIQRDLSSGTGASSSVSSAFNRKTLPIISSHNMDNSKPNRFVNSKPLKRRDLFGRYAHEHGNDDPSTLNAVSLASEKGSESNRIAFTASSSSDASGYNQDALMPSPHTPLFSPPRESIIHQNNSMGRVEQNTGSLPSASSSISSFERDSAVCKNNIKAPPVTTFRCSYAEEDKHGFDTAKNVSGNLMWCICGSKYTTKGALSRHISTQRQLSNFQCGKCNKCFQSFQQVASHVTKCTGH